MDSLAVADLERGHRDELSVDRDVKCRVKCRYRRAGCALIGDGSRTTL